MASDPAPASRESSQDRDLWARGHSVRSARQAQETVECSSESLSRLGVPPTLAADGQTGIMRAVRSTITREEDARGAFLGVERSLRGMQWRERLQGAAVNTAIAISQRYGLPELLGRVLAARAIGLEEVPNVLDPSIKAMMPDPSTLRDMDRAAARLADAIQGKEQVAIFGDYDVDGACASALLKRFLAAHALEARIYIPDRMTEGYGPNRAAIQTLVSERSEERRVGKRAG